ncbi:ABC transporter permease [Myxococcota bacterium]|nr:ABC transporter permease [Myxococcota bacterium]MBU1535783.1 ABC transporter permease [Myxococcota bacterium]
MNIVLRELRSIWKSQVAWSVGMIFMVFAGMQKYAGFQESGEQALKLLDSLPGFIKKIIGLGELDLTLASGYYVIFFLYFALMCGIHAIMQGAVVISKEERDKTADFLLVKPVRRSHVVAAKIMASLVSIGLLTLVTWIASLLIVPLFNPGKSIAGLINTLMPGLFCIQLIFLSLGLLLGAVLRSTHRATAVATAIFMGTFLLSVAVDLVHQIAFLKYFTPFKYFDARVIYQKGHSPFFFVLTALIVAGAVSGTFLIYQKKDIHS